MNFNGSNVDFKDLQLYKSGIRFSQLNSNQKEICLKIARLDGFTVDKNGVVLYVNKSYFKRYGKDKQYGNGKVFFPSFVEKVARNCFENTLMSKSKEFDSGIYVTEIELPRFVEFPLYDVSSSKFGPRLVNTTKQKIWHFKNGVSTIPNCDIIYVNDENIEETIPVSIKRLSLEHINIIKNNQSQDESIIEVAM